MQALRGVDDADQVEILDDLGVEIAHLGAVKLEGFGDLVANGENRVQRRARLLEYVGDLVPANRPEFARRFFQDVLAIEQDLAGFVDRGRLGEQAREGEAGHALAAAALADDGKGLALLQREGNAFHGFHRAGFGSKMDREIADFEESAHRFLRASGG